MLEITGEPGAISKASNFSYTFRIYFSIISNSFKSNSLLFENFKIAFKYDVKSASNFLISEIASIEKVH